MHERVGSWSGSREETRWFSGAGARRRRRFDEAGIPFEIVPGVTAGLGVTAYAGIPVTHREASSAVAFVTGHGDPESRSRGRAGSTGRRWRGFRVRSSSTWESLISRRFAAP